MADEFECEEIDPNKVISKNGVLEFQRGSGFKQITNFHLHVDGYVGDGEGSVISYIIHIVFAVKDPLSANDNLSR